jgi:hypothetical protein
MLNGAYRLASPPFVDSTSRAESRSSHTYLKTHCFRKVQAALPGLGMLMATTA